MDASVPDHPYFVGEIPDLATAVVPWLCVTPSPFEDVTLIRVPHLMLASVLPAGFDLGQPVEADQARLALDTVQAVDTHGKWARPGSAYQVQGVFTLTYPMD